MPEDSRQTQNNQMPITRYLNNENRKIKNSRYINITKASHNTRLLSINTCGFKPKDNEKI